MEEQNHGFEIDELNLRLVEHILSNPNVNFKELSKALKVDQRTVAKRLRALERSGALRKTYEVNWPALGMKTLAYVGLTTALGEKYVSRLKEFILADPRIVEAYETVGSHQYFMCVIEEDLQRLRESVLRDLEPLTADLGTSLITTEMKRRSFVQLVRFLRETKFPRSRAQSP